MASGAERFTQLAFTRQVLDELNYDFDQALCNEFMSAYAKALTETGQNPTEASSIYFTLFQKLSDLDIEEATLYL